MTNLYKSYKSNENTLLKHVTLLKRKQPFISGYTFGHTEPHVKLLSINWSLTIVISVTFKNRQKQCKYEKQNKVTFSTVRHGQLYYQMN